MCRRIVQVRVVWVRIEAGVEDVQVVLICDATIVTRSVIQRGAVHEGFCAMYVGLINTNLSLVTDVLV